MALTPMLEDRSALKPEPEMIVPYLNLFERLEAIADETDKEESETPATQRYQTLIGEMKQAFYRANLPERTTLWQMMLADYGLHPLWDLIRSVDEADEDTLKGVVVRASYLIAFWKRMLVCQDLVFGCMRPARQSVNR